MPSKLKMRTRRVYLLLYLVALAVGVFTPRKDLEAPGAVHSVGSTHGALPSIGEQILYLDGPLAWIGNFFMLMPLMLLLRINFSGMKWKISTALALSLSAAIEIIQRAIPGRVSDVRDVIVNFAGALFAAAILNYKRSNKTPFSQ